MRNKHIPFRSLIAVCSLALVIGILVTACKKQGIAIPPPVVTFLNQTSGVFFVTGPTASDSIAVGVTNVAKSDRTINFTISSPSGATSGGQYTLASSTVTIPANQAIGYIVVKGIFAAYNNTGRVDTLVIKFSSDKSAAIPASTFNNTFSLVLRGACNEGDVDLNTLMGAYANTNESFGGSPYGPYTTSVIAVNQTSATTGTITVSNIFDAGWNPITFQLDWSNSSNRIVTLQQQSGIGDAGTISSNYAGDDITVRAIPNSPGTFSVCHQTITLVMQPGVTGLGFFNVLYQVNMAR